MRVVRCLLIAALLTLPNCGPVRVGQDSLALPLSGAQASAASITAEPVAYSSGARDFACAAEALTCVRVNGRAEGGRILPATFGLPFAPGQVSRGTQLTASVRGQAVPLQLDQRASYPDGSLRFAVLSLALPASAAGQVVSFARGRAEGGPAVDPAAWLGAGHDVRLAVTLFSPQISTIALGNYKGHELGTPFKPGETITARIGDDPADTFTIRVTDKTAGGSFDNARLLSEELTRQINRSAHFQAYKIGEGGGYGTLWLTTKSGAPARAFNVRVETTSQSPVRSDVTQAFEAPRRYSASARAMLGRGAPRAWLSGPVAGEIMLSGPLVAEDGTPHPRLTARMNLRVYAGVSQARTDVILEDLWTYDPGARNWHYDAAIEQDGKTAFRQSDVTHYHHARWHRVVWSEADPAAFVQYDRRYLFDSRAVLHYDDRLAIPSSVIDEDVRRLAAADTRPMGNANVTYYFGMTGGRPDIGPVPRWTTLYLMSMDPREYKVMMANADASGSIPIHYRDRATDRPVSIDDHPGIVTGFWPPSQGRDAIPPMRNADTPWMPEPAHQPSLVYVPYMVTGDRYYLEEVQFWATWNLGITNTGARQGSRGILVGTEQTRGDAWALRSLAEAAFVTPDADPQKRYYEGKLVNNIGYAVAAYEHRSNPIGLDSLLGATRFAPWQADFMILVLSEIAGSGYDGAETWMRWVAEPAMGVWTNERNGFCRMNAPSGGLTFRRTDGSLVSNWAELQKANFPAQTSCPNTFPAEAYDGTPIGYVANAMAAAAVLSDVNYAGARDLYQALNEREAQVDFTRDPTWRVVPRR